MKNNTGKKHLLQQDVEKMSVNSLLAVLVLFFPFCISTDTITPNQPITDGKSLISKGQVFELGFFSPGNSSYRYLGIWYAKMSEPTVVWVGNRNNPISDSSGALSIDRFGNLVLSNSQDHHIWSTNVTVKNSTVAQLLDSGNFVLMEDDNKGVVWQSFDYPTHTVLPGMKFGIDRKKGLDRFLTSWKSRDDPGMGVYSCKLNPSGSPQEFLYNGSTPYWRSVPWPWASRSYRIPTQQSTPTYAFNYSFVSNQDEIYATYSVDDASIITISTIDESGGHPTLIWHDGEHQWKELYTIPKYQCDKYGLCGAYSKCNPTYSSGTFECTCLPGYEPRSPRDWSMRDGSGGCTRKKPQSVCGKGEGFSKLGTLKLPDSSKAVWMDIGSSTSTNCGQECLKNCSCTAFAILEVPGKGSGCLTWYGELMDIQENVEVGRELYVRVDASELVENVRKSKGFLGKKWKLAIPIVSGALTLFLVVLSMYLYQRKKRKMEGERTRSKQFDFTGSLTCSKDSLVLNELEESRRHPDLPIFSLGTLVSATNNFSEDNKLGEGGFGSVYKGGLSSGLEIAVKRLCKTSGQGIKEFKNEVMLIAKLQHRNLVKLLGCCVEGEEKMLIYEYMPNKSLDSFIFDQTRKTLLGWSKRFDIIVGIARGILYLHQDSRLRIIHRDLKASNILLDAEMNPKVSDFGMAKIFTDDQIQDKTRRVVGTYGYMSPEYAVFGKFSVKSDVFSFGVILLEIITGKKNTGSYPGPFLNLIGNVWDLWREDKAMEIVDSSLKDSCMLEVMRCIQIGLLCLQEDAADRPTMLAVVLMLNGETDLPYPKQPAFIFKGNGNNSDSQGATRGNLSINDASISAMEGR